MSIIQFTAKDHKYISGGDDVGIDWVSVTGLVSNFKQPFDVDGRAIKSSKSKKGKWYGMTPEAIKEAWKAESKRAIDLGIFYHDQREKDLCEILTVERHGVHLPIIKPIEKDGIKFSPDQKITDGIYPEHLVYLKSASLCGQSDLVEVVKGEVHITDYKTNKEIKTSGYKNWEGIEQMMLPPLNHLGDCNYNHYALQLSLYMYIILKHNPKLKPGSMVLHHIMFEEQARDRHDNPVTSIDGQGNPIVRDVVIYSVPYMRREVISLIHWLETNKHLLKK